jgi:hypothetical protein
VGRVEAVHEQQNQGVSGLHGPSCSFLARLLHALPHGYMCHVALKSCHIPGS